MTQFAAMHAEWPPVKTCTHITVFNMLISLAGGRDCGDGAAGLHPRRPGVRLPHPGGPGAQEV